MSRNVRLFLIGFLTILILFLVGAFYLKSVMPEKTDSGAVSQETIRLENGITADQLPQSGSN